MPLIVYPHCHQLAGWEMVKRWYPCHLSPGRLPLELAESKWEDMKDGSSGSQQFTPAGLLTPLAVSTSHWLGRWQLWPPDQQACNAS